MNDITNQIQTALRKKIKDQLENVKPFIRHYRKLDDLRVVLKSLFPTERAFDSNEATGQFLKQLLTKEDILINSKFEDRAVNKIITIYTVPTTVCKDNKNKTSFQNKENKEGVNADQGRFPQKDKSARHSEDKVRSELEKFAYFLNLEATLERIAGMAKPEVWAFGSENGKSKFPILKAYLSQVIVRLKYEEKVLGHNNKILVAQYIEKDKEGKSVTTEKCVINTGLVSRRNHSYIYLLFEKNNRLFDKNKRSDAQYWFFQKVSDDKMSQSFLPFKGIVPERAAFYESTSLSTVTYIKNILAINVDHMLSTHCERLPIGFLKHHFREYFKNPDQLPKTAEEWNNFKNYITAPAQAHAYNDAKQKLQQCIKEAETIAQSDDSRKANIYRPKEQSVGFFLPLYLEQPKDDTDFEVGVIIDNSAGSYVARTIYRTNMAYPKIRVIGNHNRSWLDPKKISNWRNPCPEDEND